MKTTHTTTALFIVLLGSAVHIVWAKPAQAAEFKQKLAEFQQAPAIEEALHILVQSYDKLDLPVLRDAASRVLRQNFPQSAFLGGTGSLAGKPWWRFW